MKYLFVVLVILSFCFSCKTDNREKMLAEKAAQLDAKERELELRQQSLALREEELLRQERLIDSLNTRATADSLSVLHPGLAGLYNVAMRCIETTCAGSAIGDTKSEQWQFSLADNMINVNAISNQQIVRVYKGRYVGNMIELVVQADSVSALAAGTITVKLQQTGDNQMRGSREIMRQDNCRIVYDLKLQKQ